jgi:hypothetical protein
MSTRDTLDMFSRNNDRGRFGDNESESIRGNDSVRSNLIELTVCLHYDTGKERKGAVLVSIDGDESKAQWIPHSRIAIEKKNTFTKGTRKNGQALQLEIVVITLPSTLAAEKRLT